MANHTLKQGIDNILRQLYSKKGDIFAELMINWKSVVGVEFYQQITPVDIRYYHTNSEKTASLSLKITKQGNHLELQFSNLIILERINNYLGYNAVSNIKFV